MRQQELENKEYNITTQNKINKKWWLIPSIAVLVITPLTLALTLPKKHKFIQPTLINEIIYNGYKYESLNFEEFQQVIENYSKIKQPYIATSITKEIDIYLPQNEWEALNEKTFNQTSDIYSLIETKIINNMSNKLRLIGLLGPNKTLNLKEYCLDNFEIENEEFEKIKFATVLKHNDSKLEADVLEIKGHLRLSQTGEAYKNINNDTMPELIDKLARNEDDIKNKINLNFLGFQYYGMQTIGEKSDNGEWIGDQKINLNDFNKIVITWFLDFLKKSNLVDYNIDFHTSQFNFLINGWNKDLLVLKDKSQNGLWLDGDYVVLADHNYPLNETTNKPGSIISSIEFGWFNPFDKKTTSMLMDGAYLLNPISDYYE